ncbi:hypothetical protein N7526_001996 [Penicillium atrosanguineum]|nr:hypothetical protein N7526_001996 [Penicillium atrosanguineum]
MVWCVKGQVKSRRPGPALPKLPSNSRLQSTLPASRQGIPTGLHMHSSFCIENVLGLSSDLLFGERYPYAVYTSFSLATLRSLGASSLTYPQKQSIALARTIMLSSMIAAIEAGIVPTLPACGREAGTLSQKEKDTVY